MTHLQPIDPRDAAVAQRLHDLLVLAHAQEAAQLGLAATLDRSVADLAAGDAYTLGAFDEEALVGALALGPDDEPGQIAITLLVVHPAQQRRGIARALVTEALRRGPGMAFSVSAGAANAPALALYAGLGFVPYRRGVIGAAAVPLLKLRRPAGSLQHPEVHHLEGPETEQHVRHRDPDQPALAGIEPAPEQTGDEGHYRQAR